MRTVPGASSRVVVVGAGLSGLSAALHLAGQLMRGGSIPQSQISPGTR